VPFLPLFIKELGVKGGLAFWAGVILASQQIAMIVMMPLWGKLADKYGRQTLWQLLLLRLLNGALAGFIPSTITLVATNTPKEQAARYVSIVQSAQAFGAIAGPSVGSILANLAGYRSSMQVSFIVVAVAVLLVYLLVKEGCKVTACDQPTSLWQDLQLALKKSMLITLIFWQGFSPQRLARIPPVWLPLRWKRIFRAGLLRSSRVLVTWGVFWRRCWQVPSAVSFPFRGFLSQSACCA
jgi:DHA1 family multidrug resistance protein-like MFS transporter